MAKYYKHGDAQYRASQKYKAENIKRVVISLNKKTDADIIEFLRTIDNVQGFIKELIRKEMWRWYILEEYGQKMVLDLH